jgi:ParB-like chromosome segregation protein Spo0J
VNFTQTDVCGRSAAPGTNPNCRLVWRNASELRPHPSYSRNGLAVSASKIAALRELGDLAFSAPIVITRERIVIDGYARWRIAQEFGRETVICLEYDLSEIEALRWLIQSHFPSHGLSAYIRILLALDLRPALREKALSNQQAGGRIKRSSNLTEAEKVDVRREIAKVAGVSVGNVTKVEQLIPADAPEVLEALKREEISIHKAWGWRKMSHPEQRKQLRLHLLEEDLKQKARELISKHRSKGRSTGKVLVSMDEFDDLASSLKLTLTDNVAQTDPILIASLEVPGKGVFFSKELLDALRERRRQT